MRMSLLPLLVFGASVFLSSIVMAASWDNRPTRSESYDDLKAVHSDELKICDGKKAKQPIVLTFSSYNRPPSGISTEQVSASTQVQKALVEYLSKMLVPSMAAIAVDMKNGPSSAKRIFSDIGFLPGSDMLNSISALNSRIEPNEPLGYGNQRRAASSNAFHFVRTAPLTFVLCRESQCSELEDPVTKKKLEPVEFLKKGTLHNAIVVDGKPELSRLGLDWTDHAQLIYRTGFNPGGFVYDHYWSMPQQEKETMCKAMNKPTNCFGLPKLDPRKEGDAFADMQYRAALAAGAGFTETGRELFDKKSRPTVSQAGALLTEYESYLTLFFVLWSDDTLSVTTKADGAWSIHRIQLNPTHFCKYAKPRTDFVTQ